MEPKPRVNLCISGVAGRMGQIVFKLAKQDPAIDVIIGIETRVSDCIDGGNVYHPEKANSAISKADAVLFFNNDPAGTLTQAEVAANRNKPIVVATTGFDHGQLCALKRLTLKNSPVLVASNFSLGVNLLEHLLRIAAKVLPPEFQPEIFEMHHARKLDAPSGTAETLAKAICEARNLNPANKIERGRSGRAKEPRPNELVGIQAARLGTVPGTHMVFFGGPSELLEFNHRAESPEIFARGALLACKWIVNQPAGWYNFGKDVLRLGS